MKLVYIDIPSIRDDGKGYAYLMKLAHRVMSEPHALYNLNFRTCAVLDQNAVALLGGLARFVDAHNTFSSLLGKGLLFPSFAVNFDEASMSPLIREQLVEKNFLRYFSQEKIFGTKNIDNDRIGYRQHLDNLNPTEIAQHLNYQWLSCEKINLSPLLRHAIVSRIIEIFMNAYGHGVTNNGLKGVGVTSCGQYDAKEGQLKLTVVDFGRGIINNVKQYLDREVEDVYAMEWALKSGNSTKTDSLNTDIPRGLGFGLLSEFVSLNSGSLSVYSNTCMATVVGKEKYKVAKSKYPFHGTLVNIAINCDGRYYSFISENSETEQYF